MANSGDFETFDAAMKQQSPSPFFVSPQGETSIRKPQGFLERVHARERHAFLGTPMQPLPYVAEVVRTAVSKLPGRASGFADTAGNMVPTSLPDLASLVLPAGVGGTAITGPLKRATVAAASKFLPSLIAGQPSEGMKEGALTGGAQLVGEALPFPARLAANARMANRIRSELATDLTNREKQIAIEKANYAAARESERAGQVKQVRTARAEHARNVTDVQARRDAEAVRIREARAQFQEREAGRKQAHEAAVAGRAQSQARAQRTWEQQAAGRVVEDFKAAAPGFADFPATEVGLADIVWGRGREALGDRFDPVMREIVERARGQTINVLDKDLAALKVKPTQWVDRTDLGRGVREGIADAAQVAEAIVGKSKKLPDVYRRVVEALDTQGLGDPVARAEYKAGMALIQYGRKSKMISAEPLAPRFDADLARKMLASPASDALRTRGQGDIFRGPIAGATRIGRPAPGSEELPFVPNVFRRPAPAPGLQRPSWLPPELPTRLPKTPSNIEPAMPPTMRERGVIERTMPKIPWWEGAALAEIPAAAMGHHGFGAPGAIGAIGAHALSGRRVVTQAPNPAVVEALLRTAPSLVSAYLQGLQRPSP